MIAAGLFISSLIEIKIYFLNFLFIINSDYFKNIRAYIKNANINVILA
jgi:hypothetical protein